jgi:hypothetical protein
MTYLALLQLHSIEIFDMGFHHFTGVARHGTERA